MTNLKTAFAECGEQLDRIIDAYERKGPEPYVPTNFPVGFNIIRKSNSSVIGTYKLKSVPTSGVEDTQTFFGNSIVFYGSESNNITIGFDTSNPIDYIQFNGLSFNVGLIYGLIDGSIVDVSHLYEVQWVDPSTLPQS